MVSANGFAGMLAERLERSGELLAEWLTTVEDDTATADRIRDETAAVMSDADSILAEARQAAGNDPGAVAGWYDDIQARRDTLTAVGLLY